jgi:hypothetical protein
MLSVAVVQLQMLQHLFIVMGFVFFLRFETRVGVMELVFVAKDFLFLFYGVRKNEKVFQLDYLCHKFQFIYFFFLIEVENLFVGSVWFMGLNAGWPGYRSPVDLLEMLKMRKYSERTQWRIGS